MIICVDVGNTTIRVGKYINGQYNGCLVFDTLPFLSNLNHFKEMLIKIDKEEKVNDIAYSSVVPSLDKAINNIFKELFNIEPFIICYKNNTEINILSTDAKDIGADLISDLVGAKNKYGFPTLIIDLGTATKFLLIDNKGDFSNCLFVPGLELSLKSLSKNAALLPNIEIEKPGGILVSTTIEAMNTGVTFAHVFAIQGIVNQYEKELGYSFNKVITGGNAAHIIPSLTKDYIYDENLLFDGMYNILIKNREN